LLSKILAVENKPCFYITKTFLLQLTFCIWRLNRWEISRNAHKKSEENWERTCKLYKII
jgi:hypothetical protein